MRESEDESSSVDSNEALCELLGISSLSAAIDDEHQDVSLAPKRSLDELCGIDDTFIQDAVEKHQLKEHYKSTSVCIFPEELSVDAEIMRRLTDEVVWGDVEAVNRTYETIKFKKNGEIHERRTLTRLENLNNHAGWSQLCNNYLRRCISTVMCEEMVLFKTKLNLKPAGGSGFAPHVDTPSLRVALGDDKSPNSFVTVMVAIDDMTVQNGCLRIAKGIWNGTTRAPLIVPPEMNGNPDAGGRAGAILPAAAGTMDFTDICCPGGTVVAFNGWAPHRSGANQSNFARRAVFVTYNPAKDGDCHDAYYEKMEQLRNKWRTKVGLPAASQRISAEEQMELDALATIPRI